MNAKRFFVIFVPGLLVVEERRFDEACALLAQACALDQIEVQRGIGTAGTGRAGESIALRQWIQEQRANGVTSVSVAVQAGSAGAGRGMEGGDRVRQMLTGFADGLPFQMRIDTAVGGSVHVQGTVPGPRLSLTASIFLELLNRQGEPGFFVPGVLEVIDAYRADGDRAALAASDLPSYLLSSEGEQDWDAIGQQVFRGIQADALTHGKSFVIPPALVHHIEKTTPVDDELEFTAWLEAYDEDEVTAAALLGLIKAQDFAGRIWRIAASHKLLVEKLGDIDELDDFPRIAAHDWPRFLSRLPDREVARVSEVLIELVRLECEERGIQPRIPDDLADIFGPNDKERRWLEFDERLQHDLGWTIREVDVPWTLFVQDPAVDPVPSPAAMPMAQARQQFIDALTQARDFAWRVDSPYDRVLGAARHLAMHAIDPGPLDLTVLESPDVDWEPDMLVLLQLFTQMFAPFEWGGDRVFGLAAVSSADSFGGVDGWTDQAFEGEQQVRFEAVSLKLFDALNRYFEALVSFAPRAGD
ncbi:hypothetical protein [Massilia sp. HP4]|uniref:hypothetical protein n=1 Tax=Massilia sp. HP4 TaxID=2562316 RepID=UPI0010C04194|nr:hypothetical protein [Massilia sp. HP4]